MSYNTKQKNLILDVLKKKNNEFTIKDIYDDLDKKVGLTTIYRFIEKEIKILSFASKFTMINEYEIHIDMF